MEDTHCIRFDLVSGWKCIALFDGHGSSQVSEELAHMDTGLAAYLLPRLKGRSCEEKQLTADIKQWFLEYDRALLQKSEDMFRKRLEELSRIVPLNVDSKNSIGHESSHEGKQERNADMVHCGVWDRMGSCAIVVLIHPSEKQAIVCNVGDSRAILVDSDGRVCFETVDQKPDSKVTGDYERILASGHDVNMVDGVARIDSHLSVARAFGDYVLKTRLEKHKEVRDMEHGAMTSIPDVYIVDMPEDKDLRWIVACDGLFESFTSKEAAGVVMIHHNDSTCSQELVNRAYYGKTMSRQPSYDNLSVIVVSASVTKCETLSTHMHMIQRNKADATVMASMMNQMGLPAASDSSIYLAHGFHASKAKASEELIHLLADQPLYFVLDGESVSAMTQDNRKCSQLSDLEYWTEQLTPHDCRQSRQKVVATLSNTKQSQSEAIVVVSSSVYLCLKTEDVRIYECLYLILQAFNDMVGMQYSSKKGLFKFPCYNKSVEYAIQLKRVLDRHTFLHISMIKLVMSSGEWAPVWKDACVSVRVGDRKGVSRDIMEFDRDEYDTYICGVMRPVDGTILGGSPHVKTTDPSYSSISHQTDVYHSQCYILNPHMLDKHKHIPICFQFLSPM